MTIQYASVIKQLHDKARMRPACSVIYANRNGNEKIKRGNGNETEMEKFETEIDKLYSYIRFFSVVFPFRGINA